MFEYKANENDLKAIEKAISLVFSKKLALIFTNKKLIKHFLVVSYDREYLYIWTTENVKGYKLFKCAIKGLNALKIAHQIKFTSDERLGWKARISPSSISDLLPKELLLNDFQLPKISGSLLGDFISQQIIKKGKNNNPYITRESYLATIIHEFAHIYYNQNKNWWYSDKSKNLNLIKSSKKFYQGKKNNKINIPIPSPLFFSELFAFCSEYYASKIVFKEHKAALDKFASSRLRSLGTLEGKKNLETEDSVLGDNSPHDTSITIGKILMEQYPSSWPEKILNQQHL